MKKNSSGRDNKFSATRAIPLYKSDLEDILEECEKFNFTHEISDDSHTFDDLNDLKNNRGEKIKTITIKMNRENDFFNYTTLKYNNNRITLNSSGEEGISLWHRIKDILEQRTPWHLKLPDTVWFLIIAVLLSLPISLIKTTDSTSKNILLALSATSLLIYVFLFIIYLINRKMQWIFLINKHEQEGFFQKNFDKILIVIITAPITATITLLIQKFAAN